MRIPPPAPVRAPNRGNGRAEGPRAGPAWPHKPRGILLAPVHRHPAGSASQITTGARPLWARAQPAQFGGCAAAVGSVSWRMGLWSHPRGPLKLHRDTKKGSKMPCARRRALVLRIHMRIRSARARTRAHAHARARAHSYAAAYAAGSGGPRERGGGAPGGPAGQCQSHPVAHSAMGWPWPPIYIHDHD